VVMPYHLHMPSYFLETFTEYPFLYEYPKKRVGYRSYVDIKKGYLPRQPIFLLTLNLIL
jgi:hypothetical protein